MSSTNSSTNARPMTGVFPTVLAFLALLLLLVPPDARATQYTFVTIADGTGLLEVPEAASISKHGRVAFWASLDDGRLGIFSGEGGALTTIAVTGAGLTDIAIQHPGINKGGTVSFIGITPAGRAVLTGSGGPVTVLYDTTGPFADFAGYVSINDKGTVAFYGLLDNGSWCICTGTGGATTTIVTAGNSNLGAFPAINEKGEVSFTAGNIGGVNGIFKGSGGRLVTVADETGGQHDFGAATAINDHGEVAFFGFLDGGWETGIFVGNGRVPNAVTTVANTLGAFWRTEVSAINKRGVVAFFAELDTGLTPGGGQRAHGIFLGPDPVHDKVIGSGDLLFGKVVKGVSMGWGALNDEGQIALSVVFTDETRTIVRADPVGKKPR